MNKRAAVRGLKESAPIFIRAGESAFHVAEQFGFQQRLRERAAIDGDKWSLRPRAVFVNGARHQFLTGSAFAGDQHAAGLRRDRLDQVENRAHFRTLPDDVVQPRQAAQFAPEVACFFSPLQAFRNFRHRPPQLVNADRGP